MLPFLANLELLTSWGRGEQLSGSPGSKRDRLCPGLLLAGDKRSTIWISCLGSLSSATPLVRAPEPRSHSTNQLRKQLVNHKESGISAEQRTPALGNFLAESLFLQSQGKGKPSCTSSWRKPVQSECGQPNHGGTTPRPQMLFFIPAASPARSGDGNQEWRWAARSELS